MASRYLLFIVAAAVFVVTLVLSSWHEGLWERSAEPPVAATQPAPPPVPTPQPAVKADSASVTAATPAVTPDSDVPSASEAEPPDRSREAPRGARTR
jgi:hypothetical protein